MAHAAQIEFCRAMKVCFESHFKGKRVLDAGSLDINGSNRPLFDECDYLGIDVGEGKNVDRVCLIHELDEPDESFDTIISTECFEHDQYWAESLQNIVRMLKPGGLFFFTCATSGRRIHGTSTREPCDSPLTVKINGWEEYYSNLAEEDIRLALDVDDVFAAYGFSVHKGHRDLRFWGVKR